MKLKELFSILYRKYPLFRTGLYLFIIAVILSFFSIFSINTKKIPLISSIDPPVGSPGDVLVIKGDNFGQTRSSGYVEVGGSRLTSSGYIGWTNDTIKIILPSNVQDGLVYVVTNAGKSKPGFFANEAGIPIRVLPDVKSSIPIIASITPAEGTPGSVITINGTNFGSIRNSAKVYFTANRDDANTNMIFSNAQQNDSESEKIKYIAANEHNYDYEYWSESEIRVRIPDGATTGAVYIETEKGASNFFQQNIKTPVGTKEFTSRKTYILQVSADIENTDPKTTATLTLRIPRPVETSQQPMVNLTECVPEPVIKNYRNTIIHQIELAKATLHKVRFTQNFLIGSYSVKTNINPRMVKPFSEKSRVLYKTSTQSDKLIKSDDEEIILLAKSIVKKETNPYIQAKLIYDYLLDNYKLISLRKDSQSPSDLIDKKKGDAYDFAIIYTTLLRACKIPAVPVSGILIDVELKSQNHWWTEFYIENFGWVPVDLALAQNMPYKPFRTIDDPREFYFGNMDSQHITFSRNWNEVKPSMINSQIVYRQRSYALQSIWEESSSENINYSSLWNDPVVLGVY